MQIKILKSQTISFENSVRTAEKNSTEMDVKCPLNEVLYSACKELIDDAKVGCADLVFKEICLEILARAKNVLTDQQFRELTQYASERMKEKSFVEADLMP